MRELRKQLNELLETYFIRPSKSPCGAVIFYDQERQSMADVRESQSNQLAYYKEQLSSATPRPYL